VIQPLGLQETFISNNDIMTRRFAVGHTRSEEGGTIKVVRPWAMARSGNPMGGHAATAPDQIAWARFHLGDGTARDGTRVLREDLLQSMQTPTIEAPGSALGDLVGISWLLRDLEDGVRIAQHGGDTIGQHSIFVMVPERSFAVVSLTNCGPNGGEFNERIERWTLEAYLGIVERDPEPLELTTQSSPPTRGHTRRSRRRSASRSKRDGCSRTWR
jgi:CubicO group peptidase (beta-lactamase class C family)